MVEAMLGYYHSSYDDHGKRRYYALTQFEVRNDLFRLAAGVMSARIAYNGASRVPVLGRAPPQSNLQNHSRLPRRHCQPFQYARRIREAIPYEWVRRDGRRAEAL